jgi:hypothetical protein
MQCIFPFWKKGVQCGGDGREILLGDGTHSLTVTHCHSLSLTGHIQSCDVAITGRMLAYQLGYIATLSAILTHHLPILMIGK